jgi:hypothetical protein
MHRKVAGPGSCGGRSTPRTGLGLGQTHHVVQLDEELEFLGLLGAENAILLLPEQFGDPLLGGLGRLEGIQLFGPCGIGDEFDDFFEELCG